MKNLNNIKNLECLKIKRDVNKTFCQREKIYIFTKKPNTVSWNESKFKGGIAAGKVAGTSLYRNIFSNIQKIQKSSISKHSIKITSLLRLIPLLQQRWHKIIKIILTADNN